MRRPALPWALLMAFCLSCGGMGDAIDPNHCRDTYRVGGEMTGAMSVFPTFAVDVLLVVDDRIASRPEAARLKQALTRMTDGIQLDLDMGGRIDHHIAVVPATLVDTSPDAGAALWPTSAGCAPVAGPFLRATRMCDSISNYSGSLVDAVNCAALHMPSSGLAPRPLDALRAVLGPGGPGVASGFRRPGDAYLFVGIVTTDDDPSLLDGDAVSAAYDLVVGAAEHPEEVMVGVVAPSGASGLAAFARSFGGNGGVSDVAADDWGALDFRDSMLTSLTSSGCVDWPVVDARPDLEGVQPDCVATEIHISVADDGVFNRTEELLAPCPDNAPSSDHCWRTKQDPDRCLPGQFHFVVEPAPPRCWPRYSIKYSFTCAVRYD